MDFILIQSLFTIPSQLVFIYALTRLLDIRRKGWYWFVCLALLFILLFVRSEVDLLVRAAIGMTASAAPPLLFARDSWPRRLFVVVLAGLVMMLAEIPLSAIWVSIVGPGIDAATWSVADVGEEQAVHLLWLQAQIHCIHFVVVAILFLGLEMAAKRLAKTHTDTGLRMFVGFFISQLLLISMVVAAIEYVNAFTVELMVASVVANVVCVVVDVLCFMYLERCNVHVRNEQRAAMLQQELESYLDQYGEVEREIAFMARVRHDLRNQASVALSLAKQGDVELAQRHVHELACQIERAGEEEVRA